MGKRTMKLATRGKRFGAGVIDIAIPFVCYIIFMIAAFAVTANSNPGPAYGFEFEEDFGYGFGYNYGYSQSNPSWFLALVGILGLLMLVYVIVECVFFAKSMSIGKAILGLQVVSSTDGKPIGFWKMLFREVIVKQASGVFLLGFIWILIDERNRGWHDKILDTYVVDLKESANLNAVRTPAPAPAQEPTPAAPETAVTDVELTPVSAEAPAVPAVEAVAPIAEAAPVEVPAADEVPVAPAAPLPKKPVIRLDVDEDE